MQRSHRNYPNTLYLNLFKKHFSYIISLAQYSKSFCCLRCGKYWKDGFKLNRHEKTCEAKTRLKFPGGAYVVPPTIFEQLEDERIHVPEELRYFPYLATFDFECLFSEVNLPKNSSKLTWEAKHVPLGMSVYSNVPDYDHRKCVVTNGDSTATKEYDRILTERE